LAKGGRASAAVRRLSGRPGGQQRGAGLPLHWPPHGIRSSPGMCGIVGISAQRNIIQHLIAGLAALEYRGYDSAGVAMVAGDGIARIRAKGKVRDLEALQRETGLDGHCGIAHTRWATHGVPSEHNAHPHVSGPTSVVHNGIIENHGPLRARLQAEGLEFASETDTEVIAHLIESYQRQGKDLLAAVQAAVAELHGAYAIAVVSARDPGVVDGARHGAPLLTGVGEGEPHLASDVHALLALTRRFIYLEEGDVVRVSRDRLEVFDADRRPVQREVRESHFSADAVDKGDYPHYMLKEIHEQPQAIADTLEGRIA